MAARKKTRKASLKRKTKETDIVMRLAVDGRGAYKIRTNEPFLTHMLEQLSKHSGISLEIDAKGDIEIDSHYLAEYVVFSILTALKEALGGKKGVRRFGSAGVLDEALVRVVLDLSGRAYIDYNVNLPCAKIGTFDTELVEEFFNGFVRGAAVTLHIDKLKGKNTHHIIESVFKGFATALKQAVEITGTSVMSTKGKL